MTAGEPLITAETIAAIESERDAGSAGVGFVSITETMGGIRGAFEEGCGVGGVVSGDAALHAARIIIDRAAPSPWRSKIVV